MADPAAAPPPLPSFPSGNPWTAIVGVLGSRKGLVVTLVVAGAVIAVLARRALWAEVEPLLRWIVVTWLGAQAAEDAALKFANGRNGSAK